MTHTHLFRLLIGGTVVFVLLLLAVVLLAPREEELRSPSVLPEQSATRVFRWTPKTHGVKEFNVEAVDGAGNKRRQEVRIRVQRD